MKPLQFGSREAKKNRSVNLAICLFSNKEGVFASSFYAMDGIFPNLKN